MEPIMDRLAVSIGVPPSLVVRGRIGGKPVALLAPTADRGVAAGSRNVGVGVRRASLLSSHLS
jgi:hypothetical protein